MLLVATNPQQEATRYQLLDRGLARPVCSGKFWQLVFEKHAAPTTERFTTASDWLVREGGAPKSVDKLGPNSTFVYRVNSPEASLPREERIARELEALQWTIGERDAGMLRHLYLS